MPCKNSGCRVGSNFVGGSQSVIASTGLATFSGLVLNNAADGYQLSANTFWLGPLPGLSNSFNVTARQLVVTSVVSNKKAGISFSVGVEARDANNAVAENFAGNVDLNASTTGGSNFNGGTVSATAVAAPTIEAPCGVAERPQETYRVEVLLGS